MPYSWFAIRYVHGSTSKQPFRPAITGDALALLVLSFRLDSVDCLYLSSGALTPGVWHVCHARRTVGGWNHPYTHPPAKG